ncbi:ABC transporter substrate-binding protein [Arthrobacter sp. 92]|uniref:ABC transporter substrate-binding protein n=1 Tax=Arthrobacter sp. 92 TaxID=3418175 RepID=UPI003D004DA1
MKRTWIASGAMVAAGALALTGCGSSSNAASNAGGPTTVTWTVWAGSNLENDALQHVADIVHQKDPNLTIKLQTMSFPDYWTKLPTLLSGGDVPCVIGMQMGHVAEFKDSLVPLDDKLSGAGVNPADFDPGIMKALQAGGKQLAVPYDLGPMIMYYNKDKFKAAGVTEPTAGWTIDEFVADAKKLTKGSDYGFGANNAIEAIQDWAPTLVGKQAVTEDGKLDVNNPDIASALKWYSGLVSTEKVAAPLVAGTANTANQAFMAGNAAMYLDGPWSMIGIKSGAKFQVGVATIPAGPKGLAGPIEGSGYGITQKCSKPDAAMKALAIITGPDALAYLGDQGRAFPARTAQQPTWYKSAVPGAQSVLDAALKAGVPYRETAAWTQDGLNWQQGSVPVINGQSPVDAFLKNVQDQSASQ